MIKTIGQSGQISLGKHYAGRQVLVEEPEPGVWILRLGQFVPDNERWLLPSEEQAKLAQALEGAASHAPQSSDLIELEKHIKVKP